MKSKYLKPVAALCLVLALAVGGTIAYLTDTTGMVVNSFTVSDEVGIELTETYQDFELIPGESFTKDPTITVIEDSSYVFVEVVEMIPTAALGYYDDDTDQYQYSFSDYVVYEVVTYGGELYRVDEEGNRSETSTAWYWELIEGPTVTSSYYDEEDELGEATVVTYVYAVTDGYGNLLEVSSTDVMLTKNGDSNDVYVPVEYDILYNDEVLIPTTLTQEMLALLIAEVEEDAGASAGDGSGDVDTEVTYYDVRLSFTGFAIQSSGLDGMTNVEIYDAAAGTIDYDAVDADA